MNDNEINDKTSLNTLAINDFFFTNIAHIEQPFETSIDVASKSQQCSINEVNSSPKKEIVSNLIKKPKLNNPMYSLPILKVAPKMTDDILFRALHPDKPVNKANLINFNTNPKLFKSFSNPTVFKNKVKPKPPSLIPIEEEINESIKFPKIDELKVLDMSKQPLTSEELKYIKEQKVNEIYKRSNYFHKVVLLNKTAKNAYKDPQIETNSILNTYNNENDYRFRNRKYGNSYLTKIKPLKMADVIRRRCQVTREMERNEILMKKLAQKKLQQDLSNVRSLRISCDTSNKEILTDQKERKNKTIDVYRRIKMTPTYVRDLKIIQTFNKIKDPSLVKYFNAMQNVSDEEKRNN